jgi:4-amino-4-deoxy-L-arabinose transferase-like glycosyltransferase
MSARQHLWLLLAVFGVAAVLRIALAGRHCLWADEVFSLAIATGHSLEHPAATADPALGDFIESDGPVDVRELRHYLVHNETPVSPAQVIRAVLLSDTSPPLYYLLLYGWTLLFGTSDIILRLFSTIWSLACLPLLAIVARRTGGRSAVIPSCVLFAFSPWSVYYSTEGRMYSLLWFWVLATACVSLVLHQRGGGISHYALWLVASAAGFLTHYFFVFPWAAMVAFLVIQPGMLERKRLLASIFLVGLVIAPWYLKVPEMLGYWRITQDWLKLEPGLLGVTRGSVFEFFSGGSDIWGHSRIAGIAVLALLALVVAAMAWRLRLHMFAGRRFFLWLWFIAAAVGPFAFDLLRGTYTSAYPRYSLAGLPAAYLLVASGLKCLGRPASVSVLLLIVLAWVPRLATIYQKSSRNGPPISKIARAVSSNVSPSDLILVHSIPSNVLGVARYASGPAALASWVGQLGTRQVPESLHALAVSRQRILFVRWHDLGQPAPEEDWLRANAVIFQERHLDSARIIDFRPKNSGQF